MSWFNHRHYWRPRSELQRVFTSAESAKPEFCFYVEQCGCGAVRTIELQPGEAPVIRNAITEGADSQPVPTSPTIDPAVIS